MSSTLPNPIIPLINGGMYNPAFGPPGKGLNNFKNVMYVTWQFIGPTQNWKTYLPTEVQLEVGDVLQDFSDGQQFQIIMASRGVGKTIVTAVFVCWALLINPRLNIAVVSATADYAKKVAKQIKLILDYTPLFSKLRITDSLARKEGKTNNALTFDVAGAGITGNPSVAVFGIGGQLTGARADIIIGDDIEVLNNSKSIIMREELATQSSEFINLLKPDSSKTINSKVILLGTPQCEDTIYFKKEELGYKITMWPVQVPTMEEIDKIYKHRLHPRIYRMAMEGKIGEPVDSRFDSIEILKKKTGLTEPEFRLQFMLNPDSSDDERYPLKLRNCLLMSIDDKLAPIALGYQDSNQFKDRNAPILGLTNDYWLTPAYVSDKWTQYDKRIMFLDPAGAGENADSTGFALLYSLSGYIFLKDGGSLPGGFGDEQRDRIIQLVRQYMPDEIVMEKNLGAGAIAEFMRAELRLQGLDIPVRDWLTPGGKAGVYKEKRICDVMETLLGSHRLVVDRGLVDKDSKHPDKARQLFYQLTRITREKKSLKKDDGIDAVSMGCQYLLSSWRQDPITTETSYKELMQKRLIEAYIKANDGSTVSSTLRNIKPKQSDGKDTSPFLTTYFNHLAHNGLHNSPYEIEEID